MNPSQINGGFEMDERKELIKKIIALLEGGTIQQLRVIYRMLLHRH
jgi:hypothetical protein